MTEYLLSSDENNGIAFQIDAETNGEAIVKMKEYLNESTERSMEWTLNLIERDEYPELHDTLDSKGSSHQIFVHQCSIDKDGVISDEVDIWSEDVDLSFDSGTAGEVIIAEPTKPEDSSGTANE
jgi:hypothetical protein